MPTYTPFPIDGIVLDIDGSTALNAAKVIVLNATTAERTSGITNSSGQFILDLANLTSGYSNGDKLQITAFYGTGTAIRSLSKRYTILLTDGAKALGNMILHEGEEHIGTCNITFAGIYASADEDRKSVV